MNIRLLLAISLTIALSSLNNLHAQFYAGLSGGYTDNSLSASTGYRSFTRYQPRGGFVLSVPIQYHFNDWFALGADLSYIQKNHRWERTGLLSGVYQNTTNSYLQLPLMAHFSFGGRSLRGFTNVGGYGGYLLRRNIEGTMLDIHMDDFYSYKEKFQFDKRRDNRFEVGVFCGLGIEYSLNKTSKFFMEARYYYGLTDLQKNYMNNQSPRYNNTIGFQLGCMFNISSLLKSN
ncbi:porin family protein [Dysgonomonas capnocytophagoides]|uniref:porin family protein n=1 Tax=Dysgonomonas capnocytophagoides TaxID=45254 RepID=UPI0030C825BD